MKLALISDIHGNLQALEAVLKEIEKQVVDEIIFLGDLATIGPQPKEVIEKIRSLDCPCITGNHDAALLDMDNFERYKIAPPLYPALDWCLKQLDSADLDFLSGFKPTLFKSLASGIELLCYHGSPQSNTDIIIRTTEDNVLDNIINEYPAQIYIGGHTHLQMLRRYNDKIFINPGSAGSAFQRFFMPGETPALLPQAEYSILSIDEGKIDVTMRQIPFNIKSLKESISISDIPIKDWWLDQYC